MKVMNYKIRGRKRAILILKIFVVLLLFFTFFSKSILGWILPRVQVVRVDSGSLLKVIRGRGEVVPKKRTDVYSDISARVVSLNAKNHDVVEAGDIIMVLDSKGLENQLSSMKLELKKLELGLESLKLSKENALLNTGSESLGRLARELDKARENYDDNQVLYDTGAISESQLKVYESSYEQAKESYDQQLVAKGKSDRIKKNEVLNLDRQIEERLLTIESTKRRIEEIERDILGCEIRAEFGGIIKRLPYEEGMLVNGQTPLYTLSSLEEGFEVHFELINEQAKFISYGDEFSVTIGALGEVLDGEVTDIGTADKSEHEKIILEVYHRDLRGGENAEVFIRKQYANYDVRVSRSAIYTGATIETVFVLIEEDTPFGKSYKVESREVLLGEADDRYVGVQHGLQGYEKVVVSSSRDLKDGDKVLLED